MMFVYVRRYQDFRDESRRHVLISCMHIPYVPCSEFGFDPHFTSRYWAKSARESIDRCHIGTERTLDEVLAPL